MKAKIDVRRIKRGLGAGRELEGVIKDCVRKTLLSEEFPFDAEISVSLTDDEGIWELNREHRGIDRPTDVLSFPMFEFINGKPLEDLRAVCETDGSVLLGDIVLSVERAKAQALEYGHDVSREFGFLTVHSVLHLLGYDHERSDGDAGRMRAREELILNKLGLSR